MPKKESTVVMAIFSESMGHVSAAMLALEENGLIRHRAFDYYGLNEPKSWRSLGGNCQVVNGGVLFPVRSSSAQKMCDFYDGLVLDSQETQYGAQVLGNPPGPYYFSREMKIKLEMEQKGEAGVDFLGKEELGLTDPATHMRTDEITRSRTNCRVFIESMCQHIGRLRLEKLHPGFVGERWRKPSLSTIINELFLEASREGAALFPQPSWGTPYRAALMKREERGQTQGYVVFTVSQSASAPAIVPVPEIFQDTFIIDEGQGPVNLIGFLQESLAPLEKWRTRQGPYAAR